MIFKPIPRSCCTVDYTACSVQARHAQKPGSKTNYFYKEVGFTQNKFRRCIHFNSPRKGKITLMIFLQHYTVD